MIKNKHLLKSSGARIRLIRKELLNCSSMKIFAERYKISAGTLKGWETNRYKRLPDSAIEILFKVFEAEGIFCTKEWLLNGEGKEPYKYNPKSVNKNYTFPICITSNEEILIFEEVEKIRHTHFLNNKLIRACANGSEKEIEDLLAMGANAHLLVDKDLHFYNNEENSPMHFAARENHLDALKILLQHGAYIDARNRKRETPFHFACIAASLPLIKFMLENGAEVNAVENEGATPFAWACYGCRIEVVELLEMNGANINLADLQNNTPLFWACYKGHNNIVTYLLNKKADFRKLNNQGDSILDIAIRNGHADTVKLLLNYMKDC